MSGTLVLVVGPSGAGKDTVLRLALERLPKTRFACPQRFVTRASGAHEAHHSVSETEFDVLESCGAFALSWRAHGLSYGLPAALTDDLAAGRHVIANVSRAVVVPALRLFPKVQVVQITAPPDLLRARLTARGREREADVDARLTRPLLPDLPPGTAYTEISNAGDPQDAARQLVTLLASLDPPATPALVSHRGSPMDTLLTNARIVTEEGVFTGTIRFDDTGIKAVSEGVSQAPQAVDCEGDYVIPGLIECHTDNMERHFMPRPKVFWPNPVAAIMAHDAQIAAAGITTVYDSVCAGIYDRDKDFRNAIFRQMIDAVGAGVRDNLFRVDHKLHLRCELSDPNAYTLIAPEADNPLIGFVSLMDHTPGRRQWRDEAKFKTFIRGEGVSDSEADRIIAERKAMGDAAIAITWPQVAGLFRDTGIPIASHDDTTEEHVHEAVSYGCSVSEFPTSMEAAKAARAARLATVAGAPNIVRGGSHSGNVAARELAEAGVLDVLSSDYVPSSLLQAVHALTMDPGWTIEQAVALVTWNAADMLGLEDRGRLQVGKRADIVRLRFVGATPVVGRVWSNGAIAH